MSPTLSRKVLLCVHEQDVLQRLKPMSTWDMIIRNKTVNNATIHPTKGWIFDFVKNKEEKGKIFKKNLAMSGFFCYYIMVL